MAAIFNFCDFSKMQYIGIQAHTLTLAYYWLHSAYLSGALT